MKLFKKLAFSIVLAAALFTIDIGTLSVKTLGLEITAPLGFVFAALILLELVFSLFSKVFRCLSVIGRRQEEQVDVDAQNALIALIFSDSLTRTSATQHIPAKYQILKRAIECSFCERNFRCIERPPAPELESNTLLYIHEAKVQILFKIKAEKFTEAKQLAQNIIDKYPQHVEIIKNEILQIAGQSDLNFDPRKFKYELPREYVDDYTITCQMKKFKSTGDVSILAKLNRNYPENPEIALNFIKNSPKLSDEKICEIVEKSFAASPSRKLAFALLRLQNRENLFEVAQKVTSTVDKNNVEKMWFLCIVATEIGHTTKASELMSQIARHSSQNPDEILHFFIANHSKFATNIELLQEIKKLLH